MKPLITHKLLIPNLQKEDEQKVRKALHDVWGIRQVEINTQTNEVMISYNEKSGSLQDFQQAIIDIGYEVN